MALTAGSLPWLVAYDLRQSARRFEDMFRGMRRRSIALMIGLAILALHAIA